LEYPEKNVTVHKQTYIVHCPEDKRSVCH